MNAIDIVFQLAILIFSVVIHEVSHGLAANALGDPTAKHAGRLTLNPIAHLDPVGSILVPLATFLWGGIVIGWAKPVPYNPQNLRVKNREFGAAIVGAAGPAANVAVALVFGLLVRGAALWVPLAGAAAVPLLSIMSTIAMMNLVLAIFNLVPIPPLDGSKILFAILPPRWSGLRLVLEQAGFFLLILFVVYLSRWLAPVVAFLFRAIAGV